MTPKGPIYPPKPKPGDKVAILSPSWAGPAFFPARYELGLRRLREQFGLEPVEYPTTRTPSSPQARAGDIHAAFSDPEIRAVLTSIGGADQLKVLRHLDPEVLAADPKPFFGYSDNVNLLNHLFSAGVVAYHGGAVMTQFGRAGAMHPVSEQSLRQALFVSGWFDLPAPSEYTDEDTDWADLALLAVEPSMFPASPWTWYGPAHTVEGAVWGGCLEVVDFQLRTSRYLQRPEFYRGMVLLLETSEEQPSASFVSRVLMCMGERGMLEQFAAVLVGRAKAWSRESPNDPTAKVRYGEEQRQTVLDSLAEYNPSAVVVVDVDLGHTEPQIVVPFGGEVRLDPHAGGISVRY